MSYRLPNDLSYCGRQITYAGTGQTTGSQLYRDVVTGQSHDVFVAVVERTGPYYSLARIEGNRELALVRVDHAVLNGRSVGVGDLLLIGSLQYLATGPKAHAAWRGKVMSNGTSSGGGRHMGLIVEVAPAGNYGWIVAEITGRRVFVHRSQLRSGAVLVPGQRVTFVEADNGRGPTAFDAHPAA